MKRREFVSKTAAATALGSLGLPLHMKASEKEKKMKTEIKINDTSSNFERNALNPYRFGGGAVTPIMANCRLA